MPAHVAFCKPMDGIAQVLSAQPNASELVSDDSTSTAEAQAGNVARVEATSNVYVSFGASPAVPSATNGHYIPSGQARDFGNLQPGWKMRVAAA